MCSTGMIGFTRFCVHGSSYSSPIGLVARKITSISIGSSFAFTGHERVSRSYSFLLKRRGRIPISPKPHPFFIAQHQVWCIAVYHTDRMFPTILASPEGSGWVFVEQPSQPFGNFTPSLVTTK